MKMIKFKTINNINMIQCGDYNWEIISGNEETDVYKFVIQKDDKPNITLIYSENNLLLKDNNYESSSCFIFKMNFEDTPKFIESLILGEKARLLPIYHKNTVKIKK